MNLAYWNGLAASYDEWILNSLSEDRCGTVLEQIDRFKSPRAVAADFGCGTGNYLPVLARRFKHVEALDHSSKCLSVARRLCAAHKNITYHRADLTRPMTTKCRADFGVCANVLLMRSQRARSAVLQNLARSLRRGAHALIVAPSVESALLTYHRRRQWMQMPRRSGSPRPGSFILARESSRAIADGLLTITDVPTKHFLREELHIVLHAHGLRPLEFHKVEYDWKTEFDQPPKWMRDPYPWDWLAVCKRQD